MIYKQYFDKWDDTIRALIKHGTMITNTGDWRIKDAEYHLNHMLQKDSAFNNHRHLYVKFVEEMDWKHDGEGVWKMTIKAKAQNNKEAKILLDKEW